MPELTEAQKARIRAEEEARAQALLDEQVRAEAARAQALLEERYRAQVRAEEEARVQALLEERYREQVRAELGVDTPTAAPPVPPELAPPSAAVDATRGAHSPTAAARPAAAHPPAAPRPAAPPPPAARQAAGDRTRRAAGTNGAALWVLAALLGLGGLAFVSLGVARAISGGAGAPDDGDDRPADLEVVAKATGPVAPAPEARWEPAELGFAAIELGPDGLLREVARPGPVSRDELVASMEAHDHHAVARPTPTATPSLADLEARAASAPEVDALARWVPPDAMLVASLDFARARSVPVLGRLRDALLEALSLRSPLTHLATETGIDVAGRGDVGLFIFPEAVLEEQDEFVLASHLPYDAARVERWIRERDPGASSRWALDATLLEFGGGGVALGAGFVVAGARAPFAACVSARAGNSALLSGELSEPLKLVRGAKDGFVVARPPAALRAELAEEAPALAQARWLSLRVVVRGERLRLEVGARFADEGAAASLRALLDGLRRVATAAPLLTDVTVSVEGATVFARATFDDAGLERWLRALRHAL